MTADSMEPKLPPTPPCRGTPGDSGFQNRKRATHLWKAHQAQGQDVPSKQPQRSRLVDSLKTFLPTIPTLPTWNKSKDGNTSTSKLREQRKSHDVGDSPLANRDSSSTTSKLVRAASSPNCHDSSKSSSARTRRNSQTEENLIELIPNKLYFALHANENVTRQQIHEHPNLYYFSCNLHESYIPFAKDFGPVDLATVVRFWRHVRSKASNPAMGGRPMVYYSDFKAGHIANAAFLLAAYMILEHGMCSKDVVACFDNLRPHSLVPFRDASVVDCGFRLTLQDCMDGLSKAMAIGWFDAATFNVDEYDRMEHPLGGDMCAIGDRFFAFRCPVDTAVVLPDEVSLSAGFYANTLRAKGVSAVVRLNEPTTYSAKHFTERGVRHYELHFADCSNPSPAVVEAFLDICDSESGPVGVHCKAGLGRTGTLIALWMMKHRGFTAREAIAWLRIVRPGSVIGYQQKFLLQCEQAGFVGNALGPMAADEEETAVDKAKAERQAVTSEEIAKRVADASVKRAQAQLRLPNIKRRSR